MSIFNDAPITTDADTKTNTTFWNTEIPVKMNEIDDLFDEANGHDHSAADKGKPIQTAGLDLTDIGKDIILANGWIIADETWTHASSDDPTYTFTIVGDKTGKYSAGMKIKLTDSGTQFGFITKVAYSSPNTTITVYMGTDYDLSGGAITNPYYSVVKAPLDFPLDPDKWTVEATDTTNRTQSNPTASVWYNLGSLSIIIPIGDFYVGYKAQIACNRTAAVMRDVVATLSNANNSMSDNKLSTGSYIQIATYTTNQGACPHFVKKSKNFTSKTTMYLNIMTGQVGTISIEVVANANNCTRIWARCAYL